MRMSVLCVVSLDGNQVMFILQMSSISHQRKRNSCLGITLFPLKTKTSKVIYVIEDSFSHEKAC